MRPLIALLLLQANPALAYDPAPIAARHGMVVSAQHRATDIGVDILRQGGNAIDAAIAVAYALAVTYPAAGNLGGGGFMTLRMSDGRIAFLDFREKAPRAATPTMFLDAAGSPDKERSTDSWRAVAIPGSPAGLEAARLQFGTLPRETLIAPAVQLARNGFILEPGDLALFEARAEKLARDPAAAAIFLRDNHAPAIGDRLIQPDLAHTLERLAAEGPAAFYNGPIADALVAASRANDGVIAPEDLARYQIRTLPPITCTYRGYQIISAPPPSSGGTVLCEILTILEGYDLRAAGFHSAEAVRLQTAAMRQAFIDRNDRLGDPDFVQNPVAALLDPAYAATIRARIDANRPASPAPAQPAHEGANTTHFAVVDQAGNAAAVTTTLNDWFGAHRVIPGTGILVNDEMDDFALPNQSNSYGMTGNAANAIAPGKTPLSSMAPTILTRDNHLVAVLGSPGGSRIITVVLNIILNLIDYDMTVQEAVDAPRLHHQASPDTLFAERFALSPDTIALLQAQGIKVSESIPWGIAGTILAGAPRFSPPPPGNPAQTLTLGNPTATGATLFAAPDPRGGAASAAGY